MTGRIGSFKQTAIKRCNTVHVKAEGTVVAYETRRMNSPLSLETTKDDTSLCPSAIPKHGWEIDMTDCP
jgi:hypothetical protein